MSNSILTVITPAATRDLTTLDRLKRALNVTNSGDDDMLRDLIREASDFIQDYTGRVWARETVSEYFPVTFRHGWPYSRYGVGTQLRRFPIVEVVGVVGADTVALTTDDYTLDAERAIIHFQLRRLQGMTITYTAGYELLEGLPYGIERACIEYIHATMSARGRDPMVREIDIPDVKRVAYWVGSVGNNGAIPPKVEGLLEMYRERSI